MAPLICVNCLPNRCDKEKGICLQCKPGYRGLECENKCNIGTYGLKCRSNCPSGCYFSKTGEKRFQKSHCHHVTGACLNGCIDGFTGESCQESCSDGYFGSGCNQTCGSRCVNRLCNPIFGHCYKCPGSSFGPFCTNVTLTQFKKIHQGNEGGSSEEGDWSLFDTGPMVSSLFGMVVLGVFVTVLVGAVIFLRQRLIISQIRRSGKQAPKWISKTPMYRGVFANLHGRKKREIKQRQKYQRYLESGRGSGSKLERKKSTLSSRSNKPLSQVNVKQSSTAFPNHEEGTITTTNEMFTTNSYHQRTRLAQGKRFSDQDKDYVQKGNEEGEKDGIYINEFDYVHMENFPSIPLEDIFKLLSQIGKQYEEDVSMTTTSNDKRGGYSLSKQTKSSDYVYYDNEDQSEPRSPSDIESTLITTHIPAENIIGNLKKGGSELYKVKPKQGRERSIISEIEGHNSKYSRESRRLKVSIIKSPGVRSENSKIGRQKGDLQDKNSRIPKSQSSQPTLHIMTNSSTKDKKDEIEKSRGRRIKDEADVVSTNTTVKFRGIESDLNTSTVTIRKNKDPASSYFASIDEDWSPTPSMTSLGSEYYAMSSCIPNTDSFAPTSADFTDYETMVSSFAADIEDTQAPSQCTTIASKFLNDATENTEYGGGHDFREDTISDISSPTLSVVSSSRFMNASESVLMPERVDAYSMGYKINHNTNESKVTSFTESGSPNKYDDEYDFNKNESKRIFGWRKVKKTVARRRSADQMDINTSTNITTRSGDSESFGMSLRDGSFSSKIVEDSNTETVNKVLNVVTTGTQTAKDGENEDEIVGVGSKEGEKKKDDDNEKDNDNNDDENSFQYCSHQFLLSRFALWEMNRKKEKEKEEEGKEDDGKKNEGGVKSASHLEQNTDL